MSRWLVTGAHPYLSLGYPRRFIPATVLPPVTVTPRTHLPTGFARAKSFLPSTSHRVRFAGEIHGLCIKRVVISVGPYHSSSLSMSFYICSSMTDDAYSPSPVCEELHPSSPKLITNLSPKKPFLVPHEVVDESEGVVLFEAPFLGRNSGEHHWVAVAYSTNEEGG